MKYLPVQSEDSEDAFPSVPNCSKASSHPSCRFHVLTKGYAQSANHLYILMSVAEALGRLTRLTGDYWYKI